MAIGLTWADAGMARPVELELVLAVDTSMSVSATEFALQMAGYAAAFTHPAVLRAIESTGADGIAVSMVQWGDINQQATVVDWTWIGDAASAGAFASRIAATGRQFLGPGTALAIALGYCVGLFDDNGFEGARRIVDLSGDGRDNRGPQTRWNRFRALNAGITINGLAILNEEPLLDLYYEQQVIGGPGAFVEVAADYRDFAEAIVAKLVREIAGPALTEERQSPAGSTLARAVEPVMRRTTSPSTMR